MSMVTETGIMSLILLALAGAACSGDGRTPLGTVGNRDPGSSTPTGGSGGSSTPTGGSGGGWSIPTGGNGGGWSIPTGGYGGDTVVGGAGAGGIGGATVCDPAGFGGNGGFVVNGPYGCGGFGGFSSGPGGYGGGTGWPPVGTLFAQATPYATGQSASAVALGDLDGDGSLDIAVANNGTVSVLLNLGDGTFAPAASYDVFASPQSIALADFDGDGKLDVVVSNTNGGYFNGGNLIILTNTGKGVLGPPTSYAAGRYPQALAARDMNGDKRPDILVVTDAGTLSLLINLGSGRFAAPVPYATGGEASAIAIGDINQDGKDDVAISNMGNGGAPGNVGVRMGGGDGTLAEISNYQLDAALWARSVAIADMNRDGHPDLIVSGYGDFGQPVQGRIDVLDNQGMGSFSTAVGYAAANEPWALAVADFDHDGAPDVAAINPAMVGQSAVLLLLNDGSGKLAPPSSYPVGNSSLALAAGDLNHDGWIDLVTADGYPGQVSVLLNKAGR
jgi:hypothetical protein